ncbi:MAG TPA: 4-(cytidine 5'-diphospho)-2-C-methyl-D-erythritol kinase [Casimicrobiaceae bacterium]|nr:4-(cytidine 5'-diphospho)-2-C-methyl-D-erythritol kinase [Casimicrobiaceae bacterium]
MGIIDASSTLTVAAPAKVNLFLHIVGRRSDNYHLLESLFVLIDWCDTITLTRRADADIVRVGDVAGVAEAHDLAVRAAHALQDATASRDGVTIEIVKRIPQGAGLGGGSSDAASVLLALNRLWSVRLPRSELASIGASLGADVPFFVGGESALARGIGDVLTPVSIPAYWLALAVPSIRVATSSVFAALQLTPMPSVSLTPMPSSAKMNVFSEGYGRNDLEATASALFAAIGKARTALSQASPNARMTGSGGCVFATFSSERGAHDALRHLPQEIEGRVVRTLARHPLSAFA